MEITANLAFEELRHACSRWRTIGCHLEVRCLQTIAKNHAGDDERCLKEVLEDWLNNGKVPTWNALCNALEAPGLFTEAKQIREKYILPGELACTLMVKLISLPTLMHTFLHLGSTFNPTSLCRS